MEQIVQTVTKVNGVLNNFIWGPIMLAFFLLVGFMFTVRTKVFQITHIKDCSPCARHWLQPSVSATSPASLWHWLSADPARSFGCGCPHFWE